LSDNLAKEVAMGDAAVPRVVLAPDKFKGTLRAQDVAQAMQRGIPSGVETVVLPIADGGDGSVDAALSAGWTPWSVDTVDAWDAPRRTTVALSGTSAIVEVADICGLGAMHPSPEEAAQASSYGVGVVLRALLERGATDVVLALGGSANTDAGAGMLRALGLRLLDASGAEVSGDARALTSVTTVDVGGLDPRLSDMRLTLACDVNTPMVGPDGSAEMFAAQKGADAAMIRMLSAALSHLASVAEPAFGRRGLSHRPGAGAAGGLGWAGMLLGGAATSGATVFLELLEAPAKLERARLVVTGEGRLDEQSLRGKAPCAVAELARDTGIPAVAVVGRLDLPETEPTPFLDVVAIDRIDPRCVDDPDLTRDLIAQATGGLVGRHLPVTTTKNGDIR
jgi:glycerate kinase